MTPIEMFLSNHWFAILLSLLILGAMFVSYWIVRSGSLYENDMRLNMRHGERKLNQLEKYNADKHQE